MHGVITENGDLPISEAVISMPTLTTTINMETNIETAQLVSKDNGTPNSTPTKCQYQETNIDSMTPTTKRKSMPEMQPLLDEEPVSPDGTSTLERRFMQSDL